MIASTKNKNTLVVPPNEFDEYSGQNGSNFADSLLPTPNPPEMALSSEFSSSSQNGNSFLAAPTWANVAKSSLNNTQVEPNISNSVQSHLISTVTCPSDIPDDSQPIRPFAPFSNPETSALNRIFIYLPGKILPSYNRRLKEYSNTYLLFFRVAVFFDFWVSSL